MVNFLKLIDVDIPMRPIAVICFTLNEHPAYFTQWLNASSLPWELYRLSAGDLPPTDARKFAGIGLMGGQASANDPGIMNSPVMPLLHSALGWDVPIIGHCLGSQLLAKALGAKIAQAQTPEIGWYDVEICDEEALKWFGQRQRFRPFQWHYEEFELPPNTRHVLTCADQPLGKNQAFTFNDLHIGLQCHVEVDRAQLELWCRVCRHLLPDHSDATCQSAVDILEYADEQIRALRPIADAVYTRWTQGFRPY